MVKSKVSISCMSTMLRENLSMGGKIFACNFTGVSLFDFPLNKFFSFKKKNYHNFEIKLLEILNMSEKKFISRLGSKKDYLIENSKKISTINLINRTIDKFL